MVYASGDGLTPMGGDDVDYCTHGAVVPVCPECYPQRRTWQPVDLGAVLDGTYAPPQPTVGTRHDGVGLFYPGRQHTIASESEVGKGWLAIAATVTELDRGEAVVYIDFEDDEGGVVGRLLALQVDKTVIRERFSYHRPEEPIFGDVNRGDLAEAIGDLKPTLAVVDGVTEGMVLHGLDPLSNKDVATFGQALPGWIAGEGPAVVSLDHVTKSTEGRGRYAIGAVHKLNGLNGAAYVLESRVSFGIGIKGKTTIRIAKDRPGQLRRHGLPHSSGMHWFGDLVLDSHDETFAELEVTAPAAKSADWRPTELMHRISEALTQHGDLSQRRIIAAVTGGTDTKRAALDYLILDGYVTEKSPHHLIKPYDGGPK
jgi:hypothetical protein